MMRDEFKIAFGIRIVLVLIFTALMALLSVRTALSDEDAIGSSVRAIDWKSDGSYGLIGGTGGLLAKYDGKSILWQSDIQIEPEHIVWNPDGGTALIIGQGGILLFEDDAVSGLRLGANLEYVCANWDPTGSNALIGGRIIGDGWYRASIMSYDGSSLVDVTSQINDLTNVTITHIAWNPIGDYALVYASDGRLYEYREGGFNLQKKMENVLDLAWKPDGSDAVILFDNLRLASWDGRHESDFKAIASERSDTKWSSGILAWKPDGSLAVIAVQDSDTSQWSIYKYDGSLKFHTELEDKQISDIAWHPSGDYALAVGSYGSGGLIQKIVMESENSGVPISPLVIAVPIITIIGGLSYVSLTESGRYASLQFLFLPLFTKIRKKHPLENKMRELIYEYVDLYPGQNYTTIKKTLGFANGTLVYHLEILKKANLIRSVSEGPYKRFYPIKPDELDKSLISKHEDTQILTELQKKIVNKIEKNPEISQVEVARSLGISRQLANYHIARLIKAGVLKLKAKSKLSSRV